jgi:hypothetical protein
VDMKRIKTRSCKGLIPEPDKEQSLGLSRTKEDVSRSKEDADWSIWMMFWVTVLYYTVSTFKCVKCGNSDHVKRPWWRLKYLLHVFIPCRNCFWRNLR